MPVYEATASDPKRRLLYDGQTCSALASRPQKFTGNSPAGEGEILAQP